MARLPQCHSRISCLEALCYYSGGKWWATAAIDVLVNKPPLDCWRKKCELWLFSGKLLLVPSRGIKKKNGTNIRICKLVPVGWQNLPKTTAFIEEMLHSETLSRAQLTILCTKHINNLVKKCCGRDEPFQVWRSLGNTFTNVFCLYFPFYIYPKAICDFKKCMSK